MKKAIALLFATLIFVATLTSCSVDKKDNTNEDSVPSIGVFTYSKNKSKLNYLNSDLEKLYSTDMDISFLGSYSNPAVYTGDKVYAVSESYGDKIKSSNEKVVMVNLKTNEVKTLELSFPSIYAMYAQGNSVYTITGLNHVSTLTRLDVETGEKKTFELDGFGMSYVYACGDTVYLVASDFDSDNSYATLYLLDEETLTVKKSYDVLEYLFNVNDMLELEGKLYIAPLSKLNANNEEVFISDLICLDLATGEIEVLKMGAKYPCQKIIKYKNELVLSNTNPISMEGQGLTFFDLDTKEIRTQELDEPAVHIQISGDYLYWLSMDKIAVYDLSKPKLTKAKEIDNVIDGMYVSTFFAF